MGMIGANGIAVLAAAPERVRSRDTLFIYRPDSDFYYLTGFPEPEAVAVLVPGRAQGEFLLFCRERNPERELWDGPRAGPEGAVDDLRRGRRVPDRRPRRHPAGAARAQRPGLLLASASTEFDQKLLAFIQTLNGKRQSSHAPSELVALDHLLHEMRLFKSRAEAGTMRRSAKIAVAAHERAMQLARPGMIEYELEAEFLHEFRRHGADCSYPPIVAAGANACVLHYRANDAELNDGDLVLIDAGCELEMYASDITRTFPVNGVFSKPQRELYEVVLAANRAATKAAQVGNHWNDPHDAAVAEVTRGLKDLGLLEGPRAPSDQVAGLPAVLHAPHRPLAWARRARRRRLQGRRAVAPARAGHGDDDRARNLRVAREQGRRQALARHRHPDRGRRADHARRPRRAHRRPARPRSRRSRR